MRKIALSFLLMLSASIAFAAPSYVITKDEKKRNIKRSVEIELSERVTEQDLKAIAEDVYRSGFKNTFIGYRLKGENQDSYWATTHFDPNLKVKVIGSTLEQHQRLNELENSSSANAVIGSWRANRGIEYKMIFKNKGNSLVVESIFADGSHSEKPLMTEKVSGQTRYYTESGKEHNEFYMINDKGDLEFWGDNSKYYTAPKEKSK